VWQISCVGAGEDKDERVELSDLPRNVDMRSALIDVRYGPVADIGQWRAAGNRCSMGFHVPMRAVTFCVGPPCVPSIRGEAARPCRNNDAEGIGAAAATGLAYWST
jgi:hypothetical protein